jgi:alanine racemase
MSIDTQMRAWIEVNLDALRANYQHLRSVAGPQRALIPMVKADAYGLGAERVVEALEPFSPFAYGVATVGEGVALRQAGIQRAIVVFTPLAPQAVELAARHRLTASVSDVTALDLWAAASSEYGPLSFHVEIDTGMGRAGFDWRESGTWGAAVYARVGPFLHWEGVYTHFHGADAPDGGATAIQWERFQDALAQLPVSREDLMVHACNSASALRWSDYGGDAIRPGIFLYGGQAAPGVEGVRIPEPVASLRARLVSIRRVPPGSTAGYGATHVARAWERWGTLAIGYGDGVRRSLAQRGEVLLHGQRVRILGRISMDMTVVDISAMPRAEPGDVATLIGRDGACEITLDEVAGRAGTISYEILTGLTSRLPRVVAG